MNAPVLRGARVRLRPWIDADLAPFAAMNADPEVMRHFVEPLSRVQSDAMVQRIRDHFTQHGFGLWALDVPAGPEAEGARRFAGFVGLASMPSFDLPAEGGVRPGSFEIGWRLARDAWGQGYASEAAALTLDHAFARLGLSQVVSFTTLANHASQAVMKRIGLTRRGEFDHPRIAEKHPLRRHVIYAQDAPLKAPS